MNNSDIFLDYIQKNKDKTCRALTCKSYAKVYEKEFGKPLSSKETNFELATYGDALLKFTLCYIFFDKTDKLSERKKEYEKDKFLIEVIAKHYNLLDYIKLDRNDERIVKEYRYISVKGKKPTKYIATTVEAVLGAIYQERKDFKTIVDIVSNWVHLKEKNE